MTKKILFTGGGTAGHVTVNLALIPEFQKKGWETRYIGSADGIEKQLISKLENVSYESISTGKLRRYFDWKNFSDPFRVLKGVFQAHRIIRREKPNIIFSKGGFVSVPVVLAGKINRVPVIIHESDITPGLANKLAIPFANKVCVTFPETEKLIKGGKGDYVGAIIRKELKNGDAEKGRAFCGFTGNLPVLLIMGGSLGSQKINQLIRENLSTLLTQYQIIHLCGKGNLDPTSERPGYFQLEYVSEELPDLLALADLIVSRAGSNSIFEFLSLRKPMLLIPLSAAASRGDQILNSRSFEKQGFCELLEEEQLTPDRFLTKLQQLYHNRKKYIQNMQSYNSDQALAYVINLLETNSTAK